MVIFTFAHAFIITIIVKNFNIKLAINIMTISSMIIKRSQVYKMEISWTIPTVDLSLILKHLNVKANYLILIKIFKYFHLYQFLFNKLGAPNIVLLFNQIRK